MGKSELVNPLLSNVSNDKYASSASHFCDTRGDILCLSDTVMEYSQFLNFVIISGLLGPFGIVTNVTHLIVFIRLGFKDTINISLFALSISDMGASIMLVWISLCYNPLLLNSDIPLDFYEIYYYTGTHPREIFMMITSFLTVFISTERYLCIFFPLKIKSIMTKTRVTSVLIVIFVITLVSMLQRYSIFRLVWYWDPSMNRSILTAYYLDNYREVEIRGMQMQTFYLFTSYFIVSSSTALFAWKLTQRSKWRQAFSGQKNVTSASVRDQQITVMVTIVAAIYVLCYSPVAIMIFFMFSSPEIDIGGKYHNLFMTLDSVATSIGALNSCVNIFVYYHMMSKYRTAFRALFVKCLKA